MSDFRLHPLSLSFFLPCIHFVDHWTVMFCQQCRSLGSITVSNNSFNCWKLRLNRSFLVWRFHLGCAYFLIFHCLLLEKQTWMGLWLEVLFSKLLSKFYFIGWLLASCSTSSRGTGLIMHSSRSWRENYYLSMSCSLMPRRSKLQIQQSKRNII